MLLFSNSSVSYSLWPFAYFIVASAYNVLIMTNKIQQFLGSHYSSHGKTIVNIKVYV